LSLKKPFGLCPESEISTATLQINASSQLKFRCWSDNDSICL